MRFVFLAVLAGLPVAAQTARVEGTVFGASDAPLPNPTVQLRNSATGDSSSVVARGTGAYSFEGVVAGEYSITVSSVPGFETRSVSVKPGSVARVDLRMATEFRVDDRFAKPRALHVAELAATPVRGVAAFEVSDYVYGGYQGTFPSPPSADLNPRRAVIIRWESKPYRFVFSHEASYCPWFELPSGAALSYQFFEGNQGWAEVFNAPGRQERNSFVDIVESTPERAWVRWTYFGVNAESGRPAFRGVEDFFAYPNGLILRKQTYARLMPNDPRGYAREPMELIALCPVGKGWWDVLETGPAAGESHALTVLDVFSARRYDVFWTRKPGTLAAAVPRRTGGPWQDLDDSAGVVMGVPMRDGTPFWIAGDASGFRRDFTRIKDHSFRDTGSLGWVAQFWNHWPIGWINSQSHDADEATFGKYPSHFAPAGMDFFALPNEESARGVFYSLLGVTADIESARSMGARWLGGEEPRKLKPR
jgi:hypothetical protein